MITEQESGRKRCLAQAYTDSFPNLTQNQVLYRHTHTHRAVVDLWPGLLHHYDLFKVTAQPETWTQYVNI